MEVAVPVQVLVHDGKLKWRPASIAVGRANATEAFVGLLKERILGTQPVKFI